VLEEYFSEADALFAVHGIFSEKRVVDVVSVYHGAERVSLYFSNICEAD